MSKSINAAQAPEITEAKSIIIIENGIITQTEVEETREEEIARKVETAKGNNSFYQKNVQGKEKKEQLIVRVDLSNCKTLADVDSAFEKQSGDCFDMIYDDKLTDCENLSSAIVNYSSNYISIDNKQGQECYYAEIHDSVIESVDLYYTHQLQKFIAEESKQEKTSYWGGDN